MAMSTEDIIATREQKAALQAATIANAGVNPALTAQYGITDPDLAKYLQIAALPTIIETGQSGWASRSQEQQAARAAKQFAAAGGQAELDRINAKIASDPVLKQQLNTVIAAGNKGDMFSRIGDFAVSQVPTALKIAAAMALGDATGLMSFPGSAGAGGTSAASSSIPSTVAADPIAAMTGTGTGVSDFATLNSAMSAPGSMVSGSLGNAATGIGYDTIGSSATGGGLLGMGSSVTPEITSAAQTLSQSGISPQVIQQAATNPTLAQQISDATGIPTSILSNANAIIPLLAGGATLLGTNAPAQPDVNSLVGTQTAANKEMAQWNTLLANPNQVGPGGSSVYDQATNTFTQTLSPAEQALYEQRLGTKGQFGTLAGDAATRMGTTLAAPMPTDSEALRQKVIDSMMSRYKTDFGNREQQKISQLQAAGIAPGTAAYETEMNRLNQQYNDAMQQAQLAAGTESQRAYTMDMGTRNQSMNEATGLFGLGQAENPNAPISGFGFQPGATAQPVNSLAAQQNQYAQNVGQYNANMQGGYGLLGLGLQQLGK